MMQSLFLSAHTNDEETLTDTSEVDVDAEHHEEEKELRVVVMDCTKLLIETQHL